jgi:deferrochelatase/peroxidase EfeB
LIEQTTTEGLNLADIQATVLRNRPMPYRGAYVFTRITDSAHARELLSPLISKITTSADWQEPSDQSWINIVFTHVGLAHLGVPADILDRFPEEFRVPMAKRNIYLGDVRDSDPSRWDYPFGNPDLHTALTVLAPDRQSLENKLEIGRIALRGLTGVQVIGQLDVGVPSNFREHFGFIDGISRPFIEGQGRVGCRFRGKVSRSRRASFFSVTPTSSAYRPRGPARKHSG